MSPQKDVRTRQEKESRLLPTAEVIPEILEAVEEAT
jgi:hypothetical protein